MKDIDTAAAPMISVPAGVLKEFIPSPNSRTPSPEVSSSTTSTSSSTTTVTRASASSPSPSQSPSPSLAASITTALQIATDNIAAINSNGSSEVSAKSRTPTPTLTSRTSSPALPHLKEKTSVTITSAATHVHVNGKVDVKAENNDPMEDSKTDSNDSNSMVNGLAGSPSSSPSANTTGVKRPNDDEENVKPDLKRIRVFPSVSEDGCKRELKITDKEVYEAALDLEYKKYEEVKNSNNQSLVTLRRIKNGIARLSGEKVPSTDSPSQSPSTSPSPAITSGPEGEDPATPGLPDLGTAPGKEQGLADKENVRTTRGRERKVNKNGLKDAILRVFSENTLYGSELGHLKQMCEKLTSTLEINMRKVAQFHKEIEDLRKVTTRLAAEHQARKGQYVAPIRIKRSVGIQAAPHIINKGIMHASVSGGNIKTISPRASSVVGVLPTSMGQNLIPGSTVGIITTSSGMRPATLTGIPASAPGIPAGTSTSLGTAVRTPNGQIMMMAPAGTMQPLTRPAAGVNATTTVLPVAQGRVVRAPLSNIGTMGPQAGTLIGMQRPILIQNDKGASPAPILQTTLAAGRGGGVIDLTDEDEGAKGIVNRGSVVPKPGTLMKVPTSATAQLVPLQGGVGQMVLLPNASGGQPTTALIVSQVSTGQTQDSITNPAVAQARITTYVNHTSSATRVLANTSPAPARTSGTTPSPTTTMQQSSGSMKHPAPLPKTPFQQVGGISKKLPPQPTLKLSHKDSSIVLSWTMAKTEDHETIASYQLYAYQEGAAPPSANLWKKVGSVKALELPMACTLTQFMPGHVYHFAVRAVDTKSRLGPFSEPRSIKLDKK
ncbi:mucin-5AC-like isoform X2 [Eriocheir sinensis]|uniref:mucin-5AC-like isoform X2 n=1 Tax=Eriocheir sinensis TaxID=95602 RepID=UPI0021C916B6|nr:mucin-5AC-like isoform X2 [Eriocheir sinensis]